MAVDRTGDGKGEPGVHWYAVSPSDSNDLDPTPRALYVGVTGNLSVTDIDGTVAVFNAVAVGYHPLRPRRIRSTGTTATNIIAIY